VVFEDDKAIAPNYKLQNSWSPSQLSLKSDRALTQPKLRSGDRWKYLKLPSL